MRIHSIGYLFKEGIKSLWKHRMMTIASVGVLISCLLLTGVAALLTLNISATMKSVEGNNSITIYLQDDLPPLTAAKVGEEIRRIENISEFAFVSKDDALANIMDQLGDDGTILEGLSGQDNFLPDAYRISMEDLSQYKQTVDKIMSIDGVDHITDYGDIATKLSNLERLIRYASIGIVVILSIVALFIISNTIKVTLFARRVEISIMKSVGATNLFVRIPFIVEGLIIGILAGLTSAAVIYFGYDRVVQIIYGIVPFVSTVDMDPYTVWLFVGYSILGAIFGGMSGIISIGKYLRKEGENAIV